MQDLNYEQFLIYLRKFQRIIQKKFNEELKDLNISSTHIGIIMLLSKKEDGYSMSELSRIISVDNALMTRNIKELEKIDYIYRDRESAQERKYHICLTPSGKEIAKKLKQIMKKRQEYFIKNFTLEEQEKIKETFKLIMNKFLLKIEKEEDKEC